MVGKAQIVVLSEHYPILAVNNNDGVFRL
jgi:hypothetical protein